MDKSGHTSTPLAGLEHTIPVFERATDHAATGAGQ
jgi:hypothetical protein